MITAAGCPAAVFFAPDNPASVSRIAPRVIPPRPAIYQMRQHLAGRGKGSTGGALRPVPCSVKDGEGRWEDPDHKKLQKPAPAVGKLCHLDDKPAGVGGKRSRVLRTRILNAHSFTAGSIITRLCPLALSYLERLY